MKRTLLLTILAAAPAFGQWHHFGEARATGYFGVGATAPVNPTGRITDTGWNFGGGVGVTKNYLGLMLDFSFNDLGLNHSTLRQFGAARGSEKFWSLTLDPVFHVNQRGPVDFYVTGGGGLYSRISTLRGQGFGGPFGETNELVSSYTTYRPGVDGGAGFSFNLGYTNRVKLFLEARYHRMFRPGGDESYVPVTLGVRF